MFTKAEIKRNLVGGLEVALFMPTAGKWFGNGAEEAVRSFAIPILFLPVGLLMVYLQPALMAMKATPNAFALMFCFRTAICTGLYLYCVYRIAKSLKRQKHFSQFVIAVNWLSVPAAVVFLPIMIVLATGTYNWEQVYPFAICALIYFYAFLGFMATSILRLPWELGGFIAFIYFMIDNSGDVLFQMINRSL